VGRAFEAIDRNPGSPEGWQALADAYLRRAQARPAEPVDLDLLAAGARPEPPPEAPLMRAAARRAVLVDPRSPTALGQAGYVEEYLGDRDSAAFYYREALRADPLPRDHFFLVGLVPPEWVVDSAKQGAAAALAEGTLVPADTVHLRWAEYLMELGDLGQARVEYMAAAQSAVLPERRARFLSLGGQAAYRMGDHEAARDALAAAYELGRDRDGPLLEALGRIRAREGDREAALSLLGRAMALRPRAKTALFLAELEAEAGQTDRALGTLRRGLSLAPDDERLHAALVRLLRQSGREITAESLERERKARDDAESPAEGESP
jgi:tetratricopeptide (TPR) repeat protein